VAVVALTLAGATTPAEGERDWHCSKC
jgi:hypothetical protein